ncbi:hypothetical protein [Salmonella enterica]|uniref:hypothetical protein n=1 Tax=Salmonella enterica TaxID=28901 RepID=UPI001F3AE703|nr:hypothetical protein [Salmonella enterica]
MNELEAALAEGTFPHEGNRILTCRISCHLYTSDAADESIGLDLRGRPIIKKKKKTQTTTLAAA